MKKDLIYYIDLWLKDLIDNHSVRTLNRYTSSLEDFKEFSGNIKIAKINDRLLESYKQLIENEYSNKNTVYSKLIPIKLFIEFLKEKRLINITFGKINYPKPRSKKYKVPKIKVIDVNRLLNYWKFEDPERSSPRGIRNRLIFELLVGLGLKLSELKRLNINDLDFKNNQIRINFKEKRFLNRNRALPMSPQVKQCLKDYLYSREDECQSLIVAFKAPDPYIIDAWPLTERSVQRIISNTKEMVGIKTKITPMTFRHAKIINLLKDNYDTRALNEFMGYNIENDRTYLRYIN